MRSKEEKYFKELLIKTSQQLRIEPSTIFGFINVYLENIYQRKLQIHAATLFELENELEVLMQKEKNYIKRIEQLRQLSDETKKNIESLEVSLKQKDENFIAKQRKLIELQQKLKEVTANTSVIEKTSKQIEYDVIIQSHDLKKQTDPDFRRTGLIITIFSLVGIILALLIFIVKHKYK